MNYNNLNYYFINKMLISCLKLFILFKIFNKMSFHLAFVSLLGKVEFDGNTKFTYISSDFSEVRFFI